MPDDRTFPETNTEIWKDIVPPVLMAFGAVSLLRTSRLLSFALLGMWLYDAANRSSESRASRGRSAAAKRAATEAVDMAVEDSFPASDPPSFSGVTAGAPSA